MQVHNVQMVAVSRLRPNRANPKKGLGLKARKGLREALSRFGFAGLVVVAEDADGSLEVLDGNTWLEELTRAGVLEVPAVVFRDMPDEERRTFSLTYDRHRKQFDEAEVTRQLTDLGEREGQDKEALSRLAGKNVDRLLKEAALKQGGAEGRMQSADGLGFLVLTGPAEDLREVQGLLRGLRERLPLVTKVKQVLGQAVEALAWEDERLLGLLLSTIRRYERCGDAAGKEAGADPAQSAAG